jgi:hypothetical protein
MASTTLDIDGRQLVSQLSIRVRLVNWRTTRLRLWLAIALIGLARRVSPCGVQVIEPKL